MRLGVMEKQGIRPFAFVLLALLVGSVFQLSAQVAGRSESIDASARVIVGYESDSDLTRLASAIEADGGRIHSTNAELRFMIVSGLGGRERVASMLSGVTSLAYVEDDVETARAMFSPDDPYYWASQWAPQRIHADYAWDITRGTKDVVVAVVDTGVDYNHEDLSANIWTDAQGHRGYDFANMDTDPIDDQSMLQDAGGICQPSPIYHGTHVAGIVGAVMNNGKGIAGLAQVSIMAVKVLDSCGRGFIGDIAQGIIYAADHGANVITLSLGGSALITLGSAVRHAWLKGAILVAASGNDGGAVSYPAAYPSVIAVGSIGRDDRRSSFSNYGKEMGLVAPGEGIVSTMSVPPYYQQHTGTSQAAPHVAGVAALVLSRNPSLANFEVRAIMNSTAEDLGDPGWDNQYGWGLVNAYEAVHAALPGGLNASIVGVPRVDAMTGSSVTLSATLTQVNRAAIAGRSLDFSIDGGFLGSAATDANGIARLPYTVPSIWGQHRINVRFAGDTEFAASSGAGLLFATIAGGGRISGVVMAKQTYERLPFASVSIPAGRVTVNSDENGVFLFADVPPGVLMVSAYDYGYEDAFMNVTVESGETTLVAFILTTGVTSQPPLEELSAAAIYLSAFVVVTLLVVFLLVFSVTRSRARQVARWRPPSEIPPAVTEWLERVHGIPPSRLAPVEMMPVAQGHQLALMDLETGRVIVVRIDKYGRPVYLYPSPGYPWP